jgi:hypothetical protein
MRALFFVTMMTVGLVGLSLPALAQSTPSPDPPSVSTSRAGGPGERPSGESLGPDGIYATLMPGDSPRGLYLQAKYGSIAALRAVSNCPEGLPLENVKLCLSNGLEQFAAALDPIAPKLPEALRTLPTQLREASRKVKAAKTKEEARAVVAKVIADVRKSIDFVRADDPTTVAFATRTGGLAADVLASVDAKIEKCAGI